MKLLQIKVSALKPHPENTRDPKEDVGELAASIKEHGILQPLVVREEKGERFTVLIGHRRLAAAKALGLDNVPAYLFDGDEEKALAVLVTDNAQHSPPDPLREAEAVAALLKSGTWKVTDVADKLGKPVRWVAQRRALTNLAPAIVKDLRAGKMDEWTPAMLATLASVAPASQEEIREGFKYDAPTPQEIETAVAAEARLLGKAPWSLDDERLVPKAGACATCPKTSLSNPGLFDDGEPSGDAKKARCLDGSCWATKFAAFRKEKIDALKAEHPGLVLVKGGYDEDAPNALQSEAIKGALEWWTYERCSKGAKGATPAFVVSGSGAGQLTWIKGGELSPGASSKIAAASRREKGEPAKKKEPTLRTRQEALEARRRAWIVDEVRNHIVDKIEAPALDAVLPLLFVYGIDDGAIRTRPVLSATLATKRERYDKVTPRNSNPAGVTPAWRDAVWPGVAVRIGASLTRWNPHFLDRQYDELLWLADLLKVDVAPFRAAAEKEIAPSKALQAQLAAAGEKSKSTK